MNDSFGFIGSAMKWSAVLSILVMLNAIFSVNDGVAGESNHTAAKNATTLSSTFESATTENSTTLSSNVLSSTALSSATTGSPILRLRAVQITPENAAQLIQGGPDATGGIGDWFISNGILCAVISDVEHEGELSNKGGVLIDLGFCNRNDDQYTTAQDLLGERNNALHTQQITLSQNKQSVSVIVQLSADGAKQETHYSLRLDKPTELRISKRLTRTDDSNPFNIYMPVQFNLNSLESFVFSSKDFSNSNGFKNEDFVSRGISAIKVSLRDADTIINHSPPSAEHGIAYGWHLVSAIRIKKDQRYAVPRLVAADDEINAIVIIPDTFYIGDGSQIGFLQIPQIPLLSLAVGDSLEIEERMYVGKHGDVATITDQMMPPEASLISGQTLDPTTALHVDLADGTPFTFVRPNNTGNFSFRAPNGDYTVRHVGSANRERVHTIKVTDQNLNLGQLTLPTPATLTLPVDHAMRLVFRGLDGTADPNFADTLTKFSVMEEDGEHFKEGLPQLFLAGTDSDPMSVELAPGHYQVYATRGPEYSLENVRLQIKAAQNHTLSINTPKRAIETPNYIASDLHVHAGGSFDNTTSDTLRVRSFVAEHGEVMVSSEHDKPVDFAPLIKAMGVEQKITSIAAAEVTSTVQTKRNRFTNGHFNFFPYTPQPHAYRRGMVNHEDKRIREVIHAVRQYQPNVIVQLNHPRTSLALSGDLPDSHEDLIDPTHYLDHMGSANSPYNPEKPLSSGKNASLIEADTDTGLRDIDFDLIEIINPSEEDHQARLEAVRKDWLSFLKQGERITGTANSDSHSSAQEVAIPRTMVAMSSDSVSQFIEAEFLNALKTGNAFGTTGPMLELSLNGVSMGGTLQARNGTLKLTVNSADWIPVETLIVQVNGETVVKQALHVGQEIELPISFNKDSFVTVEVTGPISDAYSIIYPGITPYAFSNPIYVDFDSDGNWQAPGL